MLCGPDRETWRTPEPAGQTSCASWADLVSEYAELADRTGNADLTALVFQLQLVLADDHAEPIHSRPAPTGSVQFLPPDP